MTENKKEQSFEESLSELENIVRDLESGEGNLDKSIKHYEKGMELVKKCEEKLQQAKLRVEKINNKNPEEPKLEAYE